MSVGEMANQIVREWDSFTWEQKKRLVEYVHGPEDEKGKRESSGEDELVEQAMVANQDDGDIIGCSQDAVVEKPKAVEPPILEVRESQEEKRVQYFQRGGSKLNKFKKKFKYRNQFNFEELSEGLYQKSAEQAQSEKSHFKMSVDDICKRVEYKERLKMIKRKTQNSKISPYLNFVKQYTHIVKEQHPHLQQPQVMQTVAKKWNELTPEQKQGYSVVEEFNEDENPELQQLRKELEHADSIEKQRLTNDQIYEMYKKREEERELRQVEERQQTRVEVNGFNLFAEQQRKELKAKNPKMKVAEMMQAIQEKWDKLNDAEKSRCESGANKLKSKLKQPSRYGWV